MRALGASLALLIPSALACAPSQRVARLGDLRLQSGAIISDAFVGYRTLGTLNAAKSNAVLVTPWYQGNSGQLAGQIGPGKLVDSSTYFVIMVDALGNGVSSSPSNSARQPGASFPVFTIGDIVESHYQLVTRTFQLSHLHAVVGISMGGMQVFQWMMAHPGFIDKSVSIVGSPQSQPDDHARCEGIIRAVQVPRWTRTRQALARLQPRAALHELRIHPYDYIRQAQAITALDVLRGFGGSMERAASAIRTELMVVSTWQDREVNPKPAFTFGRVARGEVLELDGRCGHQAPSCESATLWPAVARFLGRATATPASSGR